MTTAPDGIDFSRSRAILIGTSSHTEGLVPMPAAGNSLRRMNDLLVGFCGWPSSSVTPFHDLSTGDRRRRDVNRLIGEATDVLLFYFVGHGLPLPGDDLGLALTDTPKDVEQHLDATYRLSQLREQLRYHGKARIRIVILDCCFSGIATKNPQGTGSLADMVDHASRIDGTYTWSASRASQEAVYEDGHGGFTYFTKILYEVVESGIPGRAAWLTLADVDTEVSRRFSTLDLSHTTVRPEPTRMASGGVVGQYPFARNFAPVETQVDLKAENLCLRRREKNLLAALADPEPRSLLELLLEASRGAQRIEAQGSASLQDYRELLPRVEALMVACAGAEALILSDVLDERPIETAQDAVTRADQLLAELHQDLPTGTSKNGANAEACWLDLTDYLRRLVLIFDARPIPADTKGHARLDDVLARLAELAAVTHTPEWRDLADRISSAFDKARHIGWSVLDPQYSGAAAYGDEFGVFRAAAGYKASRLATVSRAHIPADAILVPAAPLPGGYYTSSKGYLSAAGCSAVLAVMMAMIFGILDVSSRIWPVALIPAVSVLIFVACAWGQTHEERRDRPRGRDV